MASRQPTKAQLEQNISRLERVITQLVTGVEPTSKLYLNLTAVQMGKFAITAAVAQKGETIPVLDHSMDVSLVTGDTLQIGLNLKDYLYPKSEGKK